MSSHLTIIINTAQNTPFHYGVAYRAMSNPVFWLCIGLTLVMLIMPVAGVRYFWQDTHPTLADRLRMRQNLPRLLPRGADLPAKPFKRETFRRSRKGSLRSGYAFAHQGGFGEMITRGKFWRNMDVILKDTDGRQTPQGKESKKNKANSPAVAAAPSALITSAAIALGQELPGRSYKRGDDLSPRSYSVGTQLQNISANTKNGKQQPLSPLAAKGTSDSDLVQQHRF
jgi:hypothetical protein